MNEPAVPPDGPIEHPEVRFEPTDVSFRAIAFVLLGAAVVGVIIFVGVRFFFDGYRDHQAKIKASSFPLAEAPSTKLPKEPRLEQVNRVERIDRSDVYKREADKLKILNSYAPTEDEGFIRVPIDRAMEYLANKLPSRPEPSPDQKRRAGGLLDAGEPNSGRMFRRRVP
jgi:hypothetical protein